MVLILVLIIKPEKLTCSPNEAVHLNGTDLSFQSLHVRLIVPGLHIKDDTGFGNRSRPLLALLLGIVL
jgi:hypothetical protein